MSAQIQTSPLDRFNAYLKEEPLNVGDLTFWDSTFEGYTLQVDRNKLGNYDLHLSVEGHSDVFVDNLKVVIINEEGKPVGSPIELTEGCGQIRVPPGQYTLRFDS